MKNYLHTIELAVRDYECDLQGIVNNAVYQNYMEHARHELLKVMGLDFVAMHNSGIDPVLIHADISYHFSLKSGDQFIVATNVELEGKARAIFRQDIFLKGHDKLLLRAAMTVITVKNGRAVRLPGEFLEKFHTPDSNL